MWSTLLHPWGPSHQQSGRFLDDISPVCLILKDHPVMIPLIARRIVALCLSVCLFGAAAAHAATPPIKHVFVIVLENKDYTDTFGPGSKAPYLSKTLVSQGQFLPQYYG